MADQARAADPRPEEMLVNWCRQALMRVDILLRWPYPAAPPFENPTDAKKAAHNVPQNTNPGISPQQAMCQ